MSFVLFSRNALRAIYSRASTTSRSAMSTHEPLLLSPAQLQALPPTEVSILDASWFMPNSPRNPLDEFLSKRIPASQYLDLDAVASPHELGLKHMLPSADTFAEACQKFGIKPTSHVVIYDSHGVFSSPRALFMFKAFGHEKSSILDGGLPRWEAEGYPLEHGPPREVEKSEYSTPHLDADTIASYEQVVSNSTLDPSEDASAKIVMDARSLGRYLGKDPEPRSGLSSGHIPYSFSLPFTAFLETHATPNSSVTYTTLLGPSEIKQALVSSVGVEGTDVIIEGTRSVITTCGSGMTAAILWLGLRLIGAHKVGLYDESWAGYAARDSSEIVKS